jgi:lactoylglutathione lyase
MSSLIAGKMTALIVCGFNPDANRSFETGFSSVDPHAFCVSWRKVELSVLPESPQETHMNTQLTVGNAEPATETANVQQAVPFFTVSNIEASLRFYVEGLGFKRTKQWIVDGKIRWCWLELGGAAIMLQEFAPNSPLSIAKLGEGVSVCFQCKDALSIYHETLSRNLEPRRPFVGNNMWVTILTDPDGYKLDFESPTDVPEETIYSTKSEKTDIGQDVRP